jgi:deoxyribose-phosphate aldolase
LSVAVPARETLNPDRIDHTLLRPDALDDEIAQLCAEARRFGFRTVCVHPVFVHRAARAVAGSPVGVAAVVGFPHGAHTTATKIFEARRAVDDGATELDVVANLGWIRAGNALALTHELSALVDAVPGTTIKVILETALFSTRQKTVAALAALAAGATFLKTSTGFGGAGATVEDVALLRSIAGVEARVKASGGIKTRAQALAMLNAGADRIGSSASVALVTMPVDD